MLKAHQVNVLFLTSKQISYETQQLIPIFLNLIINDQIYEEYTLEEEDFMQNLSTECKNLPL